MARARTLPAVSALGGAAAGRRKDRCIGCDRLGCGRRVTRGCALNGGPAGTESAAGAMSSRSAGGADLDQAVGLALFVGGLENARVVDGQAVQGMSERSDFPILLATVAQHGGQVIDSLHDAQDPRAARGGASTRAIPGYGRSFECAAQVGPVARLAEPLGAERAVGVLQLAERVAMVIFQVLLGAGEFAVHGQARLFALAYGIGQTHQAVRATAGGADDRRLSSSRTRRAIDHSCPAAFFQRASISR